MSADDAQQASGTISCVWRVNRYVDVRDREREECPCRICLPTRLSRRSIASVCNSLARAIVHESRSRGVVRVCQRGRPFAVARPIGGRSGVCVHQLPQFVTRRLANSERTPLMTPPSPCFFCNPLRSKTSGTGMREK